MQIVVLNKANLSAGVQDQVYELFKQLSPNKKQLKLNEILIENNHVTLLGCLIEDKIVGIASMAVYKVISGSKGWIEDVIVDENHRELGIGKKLIEKLLSISNDLQLSEVLLFTEEHRISAISLYKKLGFSKKKSNIYTLKK
ncbi:GCN5 family acetyltransferase [Chryseobacterium formosense]|uniref:GCN5 family acetyltransferase n=1 Tax=Chryseobacterium formosense TaxID=236814 RepID=A0A085YZE6_9FLAO|nr:GNAT family N-acetyltransferase [Chryseobacterium formosense]KFE97559.1 GCN5 family acetyltransferase [Chryseobacterium formosense]SFT74878.1 phosphinothricin acetyltransferase [Chryseobacterium formosense]